MVYPVCAYATACVADGSGRTRSRNVSRAMPPNRTPNLDQPVTQWMSPLHADDGNACASSQVQARGSATSPSIRNVQPAAASSGVTSADSTGQPSRASYWPGGSPASGTRGRPVKPRVT